MKETEGSAPEAEGRQERAGPRWLWVGGHGDTGHPGKGCFLSAQDAVCDLPETESAEELKSKTR